MGSPSAVYGIGHFFRPGQNTVMLECDAPIIEKVWRKNVYGYHPHITLYDGRSRSFAEALDEVGAGLDLQFDFPAGRLMRVQSAKGQYDFGMTSGLSYDFLSSVVGVEVQMSTLTRFTSAERLQHAAKLLQFVSLEFAQGRRSGRASDAKGAPSTCR